MKFKEITKYFIVITACFITLVSVKNVQAEDILVDGDLYVHYYDPAPINPHPNPEPNETGPVWYHLLISPGDSFSRTVYVQNNGDNSTRLGIESVELETINNLSDALFISVTGGDTDYAGSLSDLYRIDEYYIDTLGAGEGKTYSMIITFDANAGNEYMDALTRFDYFLGITPIDEPEEPEEPPGTVLGIFGESLVRTGSDIRFQILVGLILILIVTRKVLKRKKALVVTQNLA